MGGLLGVLSAAGCLVRIPPSLWLGKEEVLSATRQVVKLKLLVPKPVSDPLPPLLQSRPCWKVEGKPMPSALPFALQSTKGVT